MGGDIDDGRRRFLGAAAVTLGASLMQTGAGAPIHPPAVAFASTKQIDAGVLDVGYVERGPSGGSPVLLLHGWPYDDGPPHPTPSAYAKKFSGPYEHHLIEGGVGHNCRRRHRGPSPTRSWMSRGEKADRYRHGPKVKAVTAELNTSHVPMLSQPKAVAAVIMGAASKGLTGAK